MHHRGFFRWDKDSELWQREVPLLMIFAPPLCSDLESKYDMHLAKPELIREKGLKADSWKQGKPMTTILSWQETSSHDPWTHLKVSFPKRKAYRTRYVFLLSTSWNSCPGIWISMGLEHFCRGKICPFGTIVKAMCTTVSPSLIKRKIMSLYK